MGKLVAKSISSAYVVTGSTGSLYIDAPRKPSTEKVDEWNKATVMAAFWFVKVVSDASLANMKWAKMKARCSRCERS